MPYFDVDQTWDQRDDADENSASLWPFRDSAGGPSSRRRFHDNHLTGARRGDPFDIAPGFAMRGASGSDIDPGFVWRGPVGSLMVDPAFSKPGLVTGGSGPGWAADNPGHGSRVVPLAAPIAKPANTSVTSPSKMAPNIPFNPSAPRPSSSFFSYLFGGPVAITSPEGHTVGQYDHEAARAGLEITSKYAEIAPLFQPGGWMDGLLSNSGARVGTAITQGIEEALQNHHSLPKFMGGPANQELVALREGLHRRFHQTLHAALKGDGFPNVGGRAGSTTVWKDHFDANPGSYDRAISVLRKVTEEFDRAHGTSISPRLEAIIRGARTAP